MINSCVSAPFGQTESLTRVSRLHTMASLGHTHAIFFFRIFKEFIDKSVSRSAFIKHYASAVTLFGAMQL